MYKIINLSKLQAQDVEVIHADGRQDWVQVMSPKRPVFLRDGMKPAPSAYANKALNITEVETEVEKTEQLIETPPIGGVTGSRRVNAGHSKKVN